MTKKKVTAPLTYNPGKGRPKEHLAYLNYQEMQALKRLNGDNMERGPRGLPSFPPADAKGSSSKASSTGARGPTGPQGQARTSPAGGKPGAVSRPTTTVSRTTTGARGPTGPQGQARTSLAGVRQGSPVSQRTTTPARQGSPVSQRTVGAAPRSISGIGSPVDRSVKQAVERQSTSAAIKTPALKGDQRKTISVGPMGAQVDVKVQPGAKIRGAIKSIQETAAEAALRRQGPIGPAPQQYKTVEDFNRAFAQELARKQFSRTGYSPQEINKLAQGVYGEAAAEGYTGMNPVSRSMINSIAGGIEVPNYAYLGGSDFDKLAGRYTVFEAPNEPFKSAGIGSLNQTQGLFSLAQAASPESAFSKASDISDRIKDATHYYAQKTIRPTWADKSFERYGEHTFGTADAISERKIAAAREKVFGTPSYSIPGPVITPVSSTPERDSVPGLIQYPKLDRPTSPTAAQEAARIRGLMESYQQPPGYGKQIVERISPEYRPYDIRIPPKDQRVITKPELSPRSAEETSPMLKYFSERVPQEGTLEEGRLMGDLIAQDILRKNNLAEIAAQSPSYRRSDAVNERMLYSQPEETSERMRQVFDRSRGMPFTPRLPEGMPDVPIPRARPEVQGPPRPIRGMSFTGTPEQMFVGAEVPYRPYDMRSPDAGISAIPVPASTGVLPDVQGPPRPIGGMPFTPSLDQMTYPKGFIPVAKTPTAEMIEAMRPSGPFVTSAEDPENLRYKAASEEMRMLPGGYPERVVEVEEVPEGETSPHPYQGMNEEQEARVDETLDRVKKAQQIGGPITDVTTGVPATLITRPLTKRYIKSVKERLNKYAAMTDAEKFAAEKKDPSLIGWGKVAGIPSVSDYADYLAWAEKSGLRAPAGGGKSSGILALGGGPSGAPTTPAPETPSTPSAPSGRRPDIYYMWDLGVNIPSPSDLNYTQYQAYLAERLAAQQAMGYV